MKLYHHNKSSPNDLLGEIHIPVALFVNRPVTDMWKRWQQKVNASTWSDKKGYVHIQVHYATQPMNDWNSLICLPFAAASEGGQGTPTSPRRTNNNNNNNVTAEEVEGRLAKVPSSDSTAATPAENSPSVKKSGKEKLEEKLGGLGITKKGFNLKF